jgi:hypothetical protein
VDFLPSPIGRRAGDEGLREESVFFFVLRGRRVAFKRQEISIRVDAAVSPHPTLSQRERDKDITLSARLLFHLHSHSSLGLDINQPADAKDHQRSALRGKVSNEKD